MRNTIRACGALGVLALLVTGTAQGQGIPVPPAPGHREVTSIGFSRNGGWRVKARAIMASRRSALRHGNLAAMNTPGIAQVLDGDLRIPVVFISYSDTIATDTTAVIGDTGAFHPVFFSANPTADVPSRPYSLKTYYEQLSNGHLQIDGQLFGWIRTPFTYANIGNGCAAIFCPGFTSRLGAMFRAALDSLNGVNGAPQVDWGQFDNDGPDGVPNSGDDDGTVDFVTFIHPTLGGECGGVGGGQNGNRIWAHRWDLQSVSGSLYTTKTPRTNHPGQFIRINDYTVQSARGGNSACDPNNIMPVGTLAHETGHTFDIPDLYCQPTSCNSEGVGEWSLMGSGNYTMSYSPAAWDAWSLLTVGWIKVDTLTTAGTITLDPIQTGDTALVIPIPGKPEYFLLENRAYLQSDTAQFNTSAGSHRKQSGLLIWHVDDKIIDTAMVNHTNLVNTATYSGLHLMQADGLGQLQLTTASGGNRGDMGDPFPGSSTNRVFDLNSNPAARSNAGAPAGFKIDSIFQVAPDGPVVFRFAVDTVIAPVAVTIDQATNAILGGPPLTSPQSTYLDSQGNNNNVYDLGDYLAYLKAHGYVLSPGLMVRVFGGAHSLAPQQER